MMNQIREDRMVQATVNSVTTNFTYRGDGLRESRAISGGATTTFTWDIASSLPVVLDDGNQYVYGAGLTSMKQSGNWYYYLADGLGSTMAVVDSSGNSQKSYTYDVYGEATPSGSLANEFDFAGQQTDGTGLQYLRARYYDPETGGFLSRDPLASTPAWQEHPHTYVGQRATNATDPRGLCFFVCWERLDLGSYGLASADPTVWLEGLTFNDGDPILLRFCRLVNEKQVCGRADQTFTPNQVPLPVAALDILLLIPIPAESGATFDDTRTKHVFRDAAEHVPERDSYAQEAWKTVFERVTANPNNRRPDWKLSARDREAGVQVFSYMAKPGMQIWAYVKDGKIINAGVNLGAGIR